jgi:HD-like signal output (HDOD) protein
VLQIANSPVFHAGRGVTNAAKAGDVFTAGLLHDIGKLVHAPRSAHAEAAGCLLGLWGLPDVLVEAVAQHHHHHPERASPAVMSTATVIFVADGLAHEVAPAPGAPPPAVDDEHLARIGAVGRLPMWRRLAATTADGYGGE